SERESEVMSLGDKLQFGDVSLAEYPCPTGGPHDSTGSANYALVQIPSFPSQDNWRWCHKCQGLFFGGNPGSFCPPGHQHDSWGSANYSLVLNMPAFPGQHNWRWCRKCQGLFFAGNPGSVCPTGGQHDSTGSSDYALMVSIRRTPLDAWFERVIGH